MKVINLTQGKVALINDVDFAYLNQWKWYAHFDGFNWYAERKPRKICFRMHRLILSRKLGHANFKQVDHVDGNGLNNLRSNLRASTCQQNHFNKRKAQNKSSQFKGIYWNKQLQKWRVQIRVNKKLIEVGCFHSEIQAAKAYDKMAKKHFGNRAKLNKV